MRSMSQSEFIVGLPDTIYHPVYGPGYLEIMENDIDLKAACYRHQGNLRSIAHVAPTWDDVFKKFVLQLVTIEQLRSLTTQ